MSSRWRPCFAAAALVAAAAADPTRPTFPRAARPRAAPRPELIASSIVSAGDSGWEPGTVEEGATPRVNSPTPAPASTARSRSRPSKLQLSALEKKRAFVASLLCFFFGSFGAHHFYLGRNVAALQCLLTFNMLGFGMPLDLLSLRRHVRELTLAEEADAAALAQRGRYTLTTRVAPQSAATASQQQQAQQKAKRVGLFGFIWLLLRFAIRSIPQFVFGRWLGTMCARTLPDGVAGGLGSTPPQLLELEPSTHRPPCPMTRHSHACTLPTPASSGGRARRVAPCGWRGAGGVAERRDRRTATTVDGGADRVVRCDGPAGTRTPPPARGCVPSTRRVDSVGQRRCMRSLHATRSPASCCCSVP